VDGRPEGPYTDAFEIICCDCGEDPGLECFEVSRRLQLIRGPYPIAAGIAAYETHLKLHCHTEAAGRPGGITRCRMIGGDRRVLSRSRSPRRSTPSCWPPACC